MDKTSSYHKTVFPNGVRLILVPMDSVNSVASSVMVAAGSRYETPAINGISHFLEHMVFAVVVVAHGNINMLKGNVILF